MGYYKQRTHYLCRSLKFMHLFPLFVARLIKCGLKTKAYFLAKCSIGFVKYYLKKSGLLIFETVFVNLLPRVDICARVIAGRTIYIPCPIRMSRDIKLAVTWLLSSILKTKQLSYSFAISLGYIFYQTFSFNGAAISRRNEHYALIKRNTYLLARSTIRVLIPS